MEGLKVKPFPDFEKGLKLKSMNADRGFEMSM
jgi:hypothetical protein